MRSLELPSTLGMSILISLDQASGPARLSEIAAATRAPLSTVKSAMKRLTDHGFVKPSGTRRYELRQADELEPLLRYAEGTDTGFELALRSNPLVVFAGRDSAGYLVAFRRRVTPAAMGRLNRMLAGARAKVTLVDVEDESQQQRYRHRARADRARVIAGATRLAFPRPPHEGARRANWLGRPNPALQLPSQRALRAAARDFGLRRLVIFGSAVREDFDEDSDVDLLAETRPNRGLGVTRLVQLEDRMRELFGRNVDVVTSDGLRPEIAGAVEQEGVRVYG